MTSVHEQVDASLMHKIISDQPTYRRLTQDNTPPLDRISNLYMYLKKRVLKSNDHLYVFGKLSTVPTPHGSSRFCFSLQSNQALKTGPEGTVVSCATLVGAIRPYISHLCASVKYGRDKTPRVLAIDMDTSFTSPGPPSGALSSS